MQKVNVSNVREDRQDGEERVTVRLSSKVVLYKVIQRWNHGKADGKKSDGEAKKKQSKGFGGKLDACSSFFKRRHL
jgi:hypothetical protein